MAELIGYGMVSGPDPSLMLQPANAIKQALSKAGKQISDINLYEINEAFAAVGIASARDLGISEDVVNVNGGAIALGHPIGASGGRIVGALVHELRRRGGGLGCAAICSGGGQGDAIIVEVNGA
jgi:acetyl-CoA C-acetyltransferase